MTSLYRETPRWTLASAAGRQINVNQSMIGSDWIRSKRSLKRRRQNIEKRDFNRQAILPLLWGCCGGVHSPRAELFLRVYRGDLTDELGPLHVHGVINGARFWHEIVLENLHHQCAVVRDPSARSSLGFSPRARASRPYVRRSSLDGSVPGATLPSPIYSAARMQAAHGLLASTRLWLRPYVGAS